MTIKELINKQPDELKSRLKDLRKKSLNLRFQAAAKQLNSTAECRKVRRDIARIKTVLHSKYRFQQ